MSNSDWFISTCGFGVMAFVIVAQNYEWLTINADWNYFVSGTKTVLRLSYYYYSRVCFSK